MTVKEKLEILEKFCIVGIECKDCESLGFYDDCRNNHILDCGQVVDKIIEEVLGNLKKENEQLKQQIEKMKCCGNCKYWEHKNIPRCCDKKREP